jgi:hypothetical protein
MASQETPEEQGHTSEEAAKGAAEPDWTHGLRQLYDSVVDEDLPESFKDLLDKLDTSDPEDSENESLHESSHAPADRGNS